MTSLSVLPVELGVAGCAFCSCCCGACFPAWAWGGGGAGTPWACGPGSAISYLFINSL